MKQEKDFSEAAANIVEIAKNEGIDNPKVEYAIRLTLERFYADGVEDGKKTEQTKDDNLIMHF